MPSQLKSDTARTNGAKSQGPVTPEGRAKSSANSVRHGLTAKCVVLPNESTEEFQLLLDSYLDQFHPQTQVEMDLIETMAVSRWRLRRIVTIETTLLDTEMVRRAAVVGRESNNMDGDHHLAGAFQKLADNGKSLGLLMRYEGALNRSYDRAFKQLQLLQSVPKPPQLNEPNRGPTSADTPPENADSADTHPAQTDAKPAAKATFIHGQPSSPLTAGQTAPHSR